MPRITDVEIERLKKEVSLLRLMESQEHTLIKRGKNHVMRCVFHDDATASLTITPENNLYHCFGCGAAGSVLDWMMDPLFTAFGVDSFSSRVTNPIEFFCGLELRHQFADSFDHLLQLYAGIVSKRIMT